MLRRVALLLILLVISATALFAARHLGIQLPWDIATSEPEQPAKQREASPSEEPAAPAKSAAEKAIEDTTAALTPPEPPPAQSDKVTIDISRISPEGTSVIAGHAKPDSYVTVLEDGKPAGTAKTDSNGEWSLATEHRFASADPKLSYEVSSTPPPEPARPDTQVAAKEPERRADGNAAGEVMRKFESLVEEAREEAKKNEDEAKKREESVAASSEASGSTNDASRDETKAAPQPPEPPTSAETTTPSPAAEPEARESVTVAPEPEPNQASQPDVEPLRPAEPEARVAAAARQQAEPPKQTVIPVPIMFVYNEARLTSDGERAASLLLEYLKLKRLSAVELTGHADERGSDAYNYELSRERLDTVAQRLKDGGFSGQLKLTPKGKSEPYTGVDRSAYTGEALFQLDRRVELRVDR